MSVKDDRKLLENLVEKYGASDVRGFVNMIKEDAEDDEYAAEVAKYSPVTLPDGTQLTAEEVYAIDNGDSDAIEKIPISQETMQAEFEHSYEFAKKYFRWYDIPGVMHIAEGILSCLIKENKDHLVDDIYITDIIQECDRMHKAGEFMTPGGDEKYGFRYISAGDLQMAVRICKYAIGQSEENGSQARDIEDIVNAFSYIVIAKATPDFYGYDTANIAYSIKQDIVRDAMKA